MVATSTVRPAAHRDVPPPDEVSVVRPRASRPCRENFQATTAATAARHSSVGATAEKSPIIETPKVPVLNPPACAPTTGRSTPPARPSQIPPKRSTTTL